MNWSNLSLPSLLHFEFCRQFYGLSCDISRRSRRVNDIFDDHDGMESIEPSVRRSFHIVHSNQPIRAMLLPRWTDNFARYPL